MCRAFEETRKEGIAIGLAQGLEQGLLQGREQGLAQGREQGLAQGEEKARKNMINIIRHLMKSQNLTSEAAMDMLGIPTDQQAKYMEELN